MLVCEACFEKISFTHWDWNKENELSQRCRLLFPAENTWALIHFEEKGLSREIIHELKYRQREKVGKILAEWIAERLDFEENKPDVIVPIPLHPRKMRERGYNQLYVFTEELSNLYKIPFNLSLLRRNYYRSAQALKDKAHRKATAGMFSLTENIENRHVLIVDDVFTTGNTMSAAAWEILAGGSNKISVLVMAVD